MAEPFKGVISLDVRDSVPDWGPYELKRAPKGASRNIPVSKARYPEASQGARRLGQRLNAAARVLGMIAAGRSCG